ncbi:MAG TPA: hypothetical protein VHB74_16470 [Devosia sp.]|nr:hypothetical protein [Devosia sp.]
MIAALTAILVVMAIVAGLVAAYSAVRVAAIAPSGARRASLALLVRGQFAALQRVAGDATVPHANRFLLGGMTLLGSIVCGAAVAAVLLIDRLTAG